VVKDTGRLYRNVECQPTLNVDFRPGHILSSNYGYRDGALIWEKPKKAQRKQSFIMKAALLFKLYKYIII